VHLKIDFMFCALARVMIVLYRVFNMEERDDPRQEQTGRPILWVVLVVQIFQRRS
jgi:hypothetical protein